MNCHFSDYSSHRKQCKTPDTKQPEYIAHVLKLSQRHILVTIFSGRQPRRGAFRTSTRLSAGEDFIEA